MALAAATVWEVRPTVGSDTNGGGFVAGATGTDFSQQNAKNSGGNNGSTTDAVGNGTTTLTSATASFTAAIVGNIIYLTGTGVTTGWYQVTAFTNGTTVTLDRSPGTFTGGTLNIGGALATVVAGGSPIVTGNTIWIKNTGSMTVTATLAIGSLTNLTFAGYTTTRGDGGQGTSTWTTATNSTSLITYNGASTISFASITFSNTAGVRGECCPSPGSNTQAIMFTNCVFDGFTSAIDGNFNVNFQYIQLILVNCEIKNCSAYGVLNSGSTYMAACYVHSCTTAGASMIRPQGFPVFLLERCVFASCGIGVLLDTDQGMQLTMNNCVLYNSTTAGFAENTNGQGGRQELWNNIFYGNGTYGIDYSTFSVANMLASVYNNAFGANGTAARRNYSFGSATDVNLTGNPFNNAGSSDFSLNSTAGAGAACRAAGYQGTLAGATQSGQGIDIGAIQSASSGGGGGTVTNYIVSKSVTQVFLEGEMEY